MREHTRAPNSFHMVAEPCASAEMAREDEIKDANEVNGRWVTVTGSHPSRVRGKVDSDPGNEAVIYDVWQIIENLREKLQRLEEETRRKFIRVNRVLTHLALTGQEHIQNYTVDQILDVPVATQCRCVNDVQISSFIAAETDQTQAQQERITDHIDERTINILSAHAQKRSVAVARVIPQEHVSERIVRQMVDVPVSHIVEQIFETPKISSQDHGLQRTVDVQMPQIQFLDRMDGVPAVMQRQTPQTIEVPQAQYTDKNIDMPIAAQDQVPKTVSQDSMKLRNESMNNLWTFQFLGLPRKSLRCSMCSLRTVFNNESWSRVSRPQRFPSRTTNRGAEYRDLSNFSR